MAKKKPAKPTVTSILKEMEDAFCRGLGKKRLSAMAKKALVKRFKASVKTALKQKADWVEQQKTVLRLARKAGAAARVLTDGNIVDVWAAEGAADAIARDPVCGMGTGRWCPPA